MTDIERLRAEIQQLKQDSAIFIIERGDAISQNADLREENTELRGEIAASQGEIKRLRLIKADWRAAMTENHDLCRENERLQADLVQAHTDNQSLGDYIVTLIDERGDARRAALARQKMEINKLEGEVRETAGEKTND